MEKSTPICVTGASGYIASHIIAGLLKAGYRVRGSVRRDSASYPWLTALDGAAERLELMQANLLERGSFDALVDGCQAVLHTASPYVINVNDPQKELVEPAVQGTTTVLDSCLRTSSVKRVVLTSSIAAITDEPDPAKTYREEEWNTRSSLQRNPYHYSKTMAERAAWNFMDERRPRFDLVTINPSLVLGPSLGPEINTSPGMLRDIMTGVYPAIMDLNWGFVDVRDVATAHILAMENPAAKGRYLCSAGELTMRELVGIIGEGGYRGKLPSLDLTSRAGSMLLKLLSWTQPRNTGTFIRTHIGRPIHIDSGKIQRELGLAFTPLKESIAETVRDLQAKGAV